jgi:5-hydroxyisourate hydrolase-like protein (transthyretin family)
VRPLPRKLLVASTSLLLASTATLLIAPGASAGAGAGALGSISGEVTDPLGNPLEAVSVSASTDQGDRYWGQSTSDGAYTIDGLPADDYVVEFGDWVDDTRDLAGEYYANVARWADATPVAVQDGVPVGHIDAQLEESAHIQGTVTVPPGFSPEDVTVEALANVGNDDYTEWQNESAVYVRPDGTYDVNGLNAGTYRLRFSHNGLVEEFYDDVVDVEIAEDITVAAGGVAQVDNNVELVEGGTISGHLTAAPGHPVEDDLYLYRWNARTESWDGFDWASVNEFGDYTFDNLADDAYRLGFEDWSGVYATEFYSNAASVEQADDIDVVERDDVVLEDFELDLAAHVTGQVTDPWGDPQPRVSVTIYDLVGGSWQPRPSGGAYSAYTDEDGRYDIPRLLAGTFRLEFDHYSYKTEYYLDAATVQTATDVTVTTGNTTEDIDVRLDEDEDDYTPPPATEEPAPATPQTPTSPVPTPSVPTTPVPTSPVPAPPAPVIGFGKSGGVPAAKGSAKVGGTLKVALGTVTPSSATVKIQWFANGKKIKKATKAKFKIAKKYAGKKVQAKITATAPGYPTLVTKTKAVKVKK